MNNAELERVLQLPAVERLELVAKILDSLGDDGVEPDLSAEQLAELDRRIDQFEREGPRGLPWPEVRRRIERGESFA